MIREKNGIYRAGGSYRDPAGRVYHINNKLFRTVYEAGRGSYEILKNSPFICELISKEKLVPFHEVEFVDFSQNTLIGSPISVYELSPLAFVSHPYEWPFSALQKAALFHLELQLDALEHNVTLVDACAYNVQFQGVNPIFIDHLSFRPYREGELWLGNRQFCEQFLHPLLFEAFTGLPFNTWYRGAPEGISGEALTAVSPFYARFSLRAFFHVFLPTFFEKRAVHSNALKDLRNAVLPRDSFRAMLKSLHKWINTLRPRHTKQGGWSVYEGTKTYAPEENEAKRTFVADMISRTHPKITWDLGCNTGAFAELAIQNGTTKVVGFDSDPGAVDIAFRNAKEHQLDFLPIVQDFQNPSPALGWRQKEREGFNERCNADAVLALALVHHLSLGKNIPLDEAIGWIIDTAPTGIIEFVPKSDPVVPNMLRNRADISDAYSEAQFDKAIRDRAKIVKETRITASGRKLVWFERTTSF